MNVDWKDLSTDERFFVLVGRMDTHEEHVKGRFDAVETRFDKIEEILKVWAVVAGISGIALGSLASLLGVALQHWK